MTWWRLNDEEEKKNNKQNASVRLIPTLTFQSDKILACIETPCSPSDILSGGPGMSFDISF